MTPLPKSLRPWLRPVVLAALLMGSALLYLLGQRAWQDPPPSGTPPGQPGAATPRALTPAGPRHGTAGSARPAGAADAASADRVARLLTERDTDTRERLFLEIVAQRNGALPALRAAVRDTTSPEALERLFRALAAIGTVESLDMFMAYLTEDAHHPLRDRLAPQLASLDSREPAKNVLAWLVASTNYDITRASVACLQRLADAPLLAVLRDTYGEPGRSDFQKQYLRAVVRDVRDPGCVPVLAGMLGSAGDPALCDAAAAGLAHIGTRDAVDALVERAEAEGPLSDGHYLLAALGAVRNKETRSHLNALFDAATDPRIKYALGLALAALPAPPD